MRGARIAKATPPRGERKPGRLRSRDHLDWLKTLPCLACGCRPPCDPAHLRFNHAEPVHKGAAGLQPPDDKAVPLCRDCHNREEDGKVTFWGLCMAKGISDPVAVAARLYRISGETARGFAAIQHARPGLPTAAMQP